MNETKFSRKEILPAFLGVLIGTGVICILMTILAPMVAGNAIIGDFGTLIGGCMSGDFKARVLWFLADFTETTFLACPLASIFMIVGAFVAAALEKKKSPAAGTGVGGTSGIFPVLFISAALSMILGQLVFGSFFQYGWIPTFASFLTIQAFVLYYGTDFKKVLTSMVIGLPLTFLVCHYVLQLVISPLGLPLFLSVSAGVFIVVPVCTAIFKLFPWMTPAAPAPAAECGEAPPFVPNRFFFNQVFGDIGSLAIWGSSIASLAMYVGAIIAWVLNPLNPVYALNNVPLFIFAQIATGALALFIYYPKWRKEGFACTFASVVFISAILTTYSCHPVIVVLSIIVGALVGAPAVDLSMKLFKFKGQSHPIPFVQFGILVVVAAWSYVIKLILIPILGL